VLLKVSAKDTHESAWILAGCWAVVFSRRTGAGSAAPVRSPLVGQVPVRVLAFSPDGRSLFVGTRQGVSQTWDLPTHKPLGHPTTNAGPVLASRFLAGGGRFLLAGEDGVRRLVLPDPLPGPPAAIVRRVELATGMEATPEGGVRTLDPARWVDLRRRLARDRPQDPAPAPGRVHPDGDGPEMNHEGAETQSRKQEG
jgi:hypothetical protein